jgi:hypothetical protein
MKLLSFVLLATVAISMTGCATLFKGSHSTVCFDSEPQGADVYINGQRHGRTPFALDCSNKQPLMVTFKKPGFADKTCVIDTKIAAGWVILDVLGGLIPVLIDAATENWYSLESTEASALLEVDSSSTDFACQMGG